MTAADTKEPDQTIRGSPTGGAVFSLLICLPMHYWNI